MLLFNSELQIQLNVMSARARAPAALHRQAKLRRHTHIYTIAYILYEAWKRERERENEYSTQRLGTTPYVVCMYRQTE